MGPQGRSIKGGGGLARVPNLRVRKPICDLGSHTQGGKDESTSCRGTVQSVWQKPPVRRKGGRARLPKNGKWSPRGTETTVLTYPGSAPRQKTALGSLSTGSLAGRTPPHGDGSMNSPANVRAGKVLRSPVRVLPSVIVVTEKVMREADGPVGRAALTAHFGWKGDRSGVRLESWPKITSVANTSRSLGPTILSRIVQTYFTVALRNDDIQEPPTR